MRTRFGFLGALAFPCLLTLSLSEAAYSQPTNPLAQNRDPGYTYLNCEGVDAECLVSETPVSGVRIVRPKDYPKRPAHYLSSNLYTTLASDRETGNRFCSFDFQVAPLIGGPDAHTHRNEWESFFITEGNVRFVEGVDPSVPFNFIEHDTPAGTVVYGSQGPVHGFKNISSMPARIFSFVMPCGLDQFFHNSGEEVVDFNAPIPPISNEEIVRTAFWAEQRGDGLFFQGAPPPIVPAGTPAQVVSSINDTKRPVETGPFGETRVVLLTPAEVGSTTGATAFCGPGRPGRAGGSVKYSYFSLPTQRSDFPSNFVSQYTEVFYTMGGSLSFNFGGFIGTPVTVETGTYVQIEPGVPFSIANLQVAGQTRSVPAQTLAISVIPPPACQ